MRRRFVDKIVFMLFVLVFIEKRENINKTTWRPPISLWEKRDPDYFFQKQSLSLKSHCFMHAATLLKRSSRVTKSFVAIRIAIIVSPKKNLNLYFFVSSSNCLYTVIGGLSRILLQHRCFWLNFVNIFRAAIK